MITSELQQSRIIRIPEDDADVSKHAGVLTTYIILLIYIYIYVFVCVCVFCALVSMVNP